MIWRRLYIPAQLGAILLAGGLAGFASLILGGALGGVAMGVAPEPTFRLTEGLLCADDARLEYFSIRRSYHRPGESEPHVECVAADGTRQDVLLKAILVVLLIAFAAAFTSVFVILLIPFSLAAYCAGRGMRGRSP